MKEIHSQQIHSISDLFPGFIFSQIPSQPFVNQAKQASIPEVAALLEDNRFLYDRDVITPKDCHEGHMRNPCILKVSRSTLFSHIPH